MRTSPGGEGQTPRRVPRSSEVLAGLDDAGGHAGLGGLAPGARVVDLLVADLAVDLEHAVVVRNMWSATGRVKAYCVSVSTFILTTP